MPAHRDVYDVINLKTSESIQFVDQDRPTWNEEKVSRF